MNKVDINLSMNTILEFEKFVGKDIYDTSVEDIQQYVSHMIETNTNRYNNFIHIARYYYYTNKKTEYIHMTKYFNTIGVLENIVDRINLYEGKDIATKFIKDIELPPLGTESKELPRFTKYFMSKLEKYLPKESCNNVLAGNNHSLSFDSQKGEVEAYKKASSLKEYLKDRHTRKVQELQEHLDNNKVWFEQVITKESVDFVKSNQEVLSGVLENDKLYITKIPYDLSNYLNEDDDVMKRYYACHCSFVRENIKDQKEDIPKEWCYCSGGFAKFPFEVILGQNLNINLLKTPIDGDEVCRFEIDLTGIPYKK